MSIPPYARLAAKLLKRERELLPAAAPPPGVVRDDAVAALSRALVRRARRRRMQRGAAAGIAVAAALGLGWFAAYPSRPDAPEVASAVPPTQVIVHAFGSGARVTGAGPDGTLQKPGARVQALPNGRALLAFKTGTRVSLEEQGDLTLVENDAAQVLALDRGALRADVAKLGPGRKFVVHTPDTEVEVHGTSFKVSTNTDAVRCGDGVLTRVDVFEGVVSVRHAGIEHRLHKGEHWPASCPEAAPQAPAESVLAPAPPVQPEAPAQARALDPARAQARALDPARAQARAREPGSAPPQASSLDAAADRLLDSSLTEQNDAFAAAVAAHRVGDLARAVRGFDALLARFPNGPLAESAAVQRMKVMREIDRARATALARDYLQRYPHGFARDQAAMLVAESP